MSDDVEERTFDEIDREILADDELEEKRRRNVAFLPNAITTLSMFSGFFAIMKAMEGDFKLAVWAIFAAGIFDMMDGRVARMTKSTSAFGIQYDSLSDLISFGFAPAIIAYTWVLHSFGRLGWAAAFLYLACTAIRLAKFNTLVEEEESRRYFRGVPSPGAAGLLIMMIMMHIDFNPDMYPAGGVGVPPDSFLIQGGMLIWVISLGLLMISDIRFRTFKDMNFKKYGPWLPLVALVGMIAIFMARPEQTLFMIGSTYLAIGIIEGGVIFRRREKEIREQRKAARKERRAKRKLEKKRIRLAKKDAKKKNNGMRAV
jgi:CDP-diacylglycerol---serine O-phosphatidyltransferase